MQPRRGPRLVRRPTFILCTLRSGSTLLRVLLDGHSQLHAPHEIHLRYISVGLDNKYSARSMKAMRFDARELEHLLWDRILDRTLTRSRKRYIVEKTPNHVFIADRLLECWPDARFIFLLRHPGAILRSRAAVLGERHDPEANLDLIRRYCEALEAARRAYTGFEVRYEELTEEPERVLRGVCAFLGVRFEPAMLDYGQFKHGPYRAGLGDWKDKIKSGRVQRAEPPPDELPEPLRELARAWGYRG
jgi:Sulfotransferase family